MIFARSRVTIRFFPRHVGPLFENRIREIVLLVMDLADCKFWNGNRYHALIWLAFHLYFYATGYGFYLLAAQMAVAANFALIIHLLLDAEVM